MKFLITLVVLVVFLKILTAFIEINDGFQTISHLAEAAVYVTKRYIRPKTNTIVIIQNSVRSQNQTQNIQLLETYLRNMKDSFGLQLFLGQVDSKPWEYNVFVVDNFFSFV